MDNLEQKKLHKNANRKVTVTLKKADYEVENTSEVKPDDISVVEMSDNQKTISWNNELLEYLKSIISMEIAAKNNNEELKAFQKIPEEKIDYNPPKEPEKKHPNRKQFTEPRKPEISPLLFKLALSVIIFFISPVVGVIYDKIGTGGHEVWEVIPIMIMSIAPFYAIYLAVSSVVKYIKDNKCYQKSQFEYQNNIRNEDLIYQEQCKKSKEEFDRKMQEYQIAYDKYQQEYEELVKNNQESRKLKLQEFNDTSQQLSAELADLYSKNILHEKYRNIEAVTAIYNYLSTDRCQTLEGRDGAYNLYEEEKTKQKTDEQIKELEAVIANLQKELADEQEQKRIRAQLDILNRGMLRDSIQFSTDRLSDSIHDLSMNIDNYL